MAGADKYAHLLAPLRDLASNWNIDVARELEDYLGALQTLEVRRAAPPAAPRHAGNARTAAAALTPPVSPSHARTRRSPLMAAPRA